MEKSILQQISFKFNIIGEFISAEPYGEGHINRTYLVSTTAKRYILQMVNKNVFKNTVAVIDNIELVTDFLHKKIIERGGDVYREALVLVPAFDGKKYYIDEDGELWRMYIFIEDAVCYQTVTDASVFEKSGAAFGNFQKLLAEFNAEKLVETIPNFHNTRIRFENLLKAIKEDKCNRAADIQKDIEFALARIPDGNIVVDKIASGEIPVRVTHNDTKLNNIMIDRQSKEGICVIDLDTVMPGSMLYDFGDSIRFGASSAAEDETDLEKVKIRLDMFEAYVKGFVGAVKDDMTDAEKELLAFSGKLLTLECGIRFLTDYLEGDTYFRTKYAGHNLDRARNQFALVADMEKNIYAMNEIVKKYC